MAKLVWDNIGERIYETGVRQAVLYPIDSTGKYPNGYAWNGLTGVTERPTGAEQTALYANDAKYVNLTSAEEFEGTIEAYTYPDEWAECDGSASIATGVYATQQSRKTFGLSYRTAIGNDTDGTDYGYQLHLVYGALASPSEKSRATINDSPEAITFSWEFKTTPVNITGGKPTAHIYVDSRTVDPTKLTALEAILYGDDDTEARLPLPDEVVELVGTVSTSSDDGDDDSGSVG